MIIEKEIIKKLLDFMHKSVLSEGGDGDAFWYSRYFKLDEIEPIIREFNKENNIKWEIKMDEDFIMWGENQEWALITNSKKQYDNSAEWITIKLIY